MNTTEFKVLKDVIENLGTSINTRFADEQKETLEKVEEMFNQRNQQISSSDAGWNEFSKIERYLEALIRVASVDGHKVHEEINEAVKKLKELAYN